MDFGPQAKKRLKEQGRKITWLAEKIGCTREHLSLVLSGYREPSVDLIVKIAGELGMDVPAKVAAKARASA